MIGTGLRPTANPTARLAPVSRPVPRSERRNESGRTESTGRRPIPGAENPFLPSAGRHRTPSSRRRNRRRVERQHPERPAHRRDASQNNQVRGVDRLSPTASEWTRIPRESLDQRGFRQSGMSWREAPSSSYSFLGRPVIDRVVQSGPKMLGHIRAPRPPALAAGNQVSRQGW